MTLSAGDRTYLGSMTDYTKADFSADWGFYVEVASAVGASGTSGGRAPLGEVGDWIVDNKVSGTYIKATSAGDFLSIGASANFITTGSASDFLSTGASANFITTGSASDFLSTGASANFITTGSASDFLSTGASANFITTGSASDFLSTGASANWVTTGSAVSYITSMGDDGSPALGGNLDLNAKYIDADVTPGSDHTGQGGFRFEVTAGQNVSALHGARIKPDGTWAMTDADNLSTALGLGVFLSTVVSNGTVGVLTPFPVIRDDTWNWTVGSPIFFHTTTGDLTQTQPAGANDYIVMAGMATHADRMLLTPGYCYIKHA